MAKNKKRFEILEGEKFVCIKKVVMEDSTKAVTYRKGVIYTSEFYGCVTNDEHNVFHGWNNSKEFKTYFLKIVKK
jgi:hypothetical protein